MSSKNKSMEPYLLYNQKPNLLPSSEWQIE